MKRFFVVVTLLITAVAVIGVACKSKTEGTGGGMPAGKLIATVKVNSLTATLLNSTGQLKRGDQEVTLAFNDASGKPVDVGAVSLNFHMPQMAGMAEMNAAVTLTTTDTPGVYRGKVNIEVAGEWQGQLAIEGPAGKGKATFTVNAQ
ncbi:MAG TPA: FixH family protein [Candidatus Dormibacteraeota bacterium]|nr:FixH family protein [Candidatus Dormibacteraeota bacterium]